MIKVLSIVLLFASTCLCACATDNTISINFAGLLNGVELPHSSSPSPAPSAPQPSVRAYAVTSSRRLISFYTGAPSYMTSDMAITGDLPASASLYGIDFRPATTELFALGSNSAIYTLNTTTGYATFVANLSVPLNGNNFGFDFNPTVDRIRITSDAGQNLRVNPANGVAIVDGPLRFANNNATGSVVASAYGNNLNSTTITALYNLDSSSNALLDQRPANDGTLFLRTNLSVDVTPMSSFDIVGRALAYVTIPDGTMTKVYHLEISNGTLTLTGQVPATLTGFALYIF